MLGCQYYCKLFPLSPAAGVEFSSLYDIGRSKVSSPEGRLVHCYWSSRMRRPIANLRKLIIFRFGGFVIEMKQCLVLAELGCGLAYQWLQDVTLSILFEIASSFKITRQDPRLIASACFESARHNHTDLFYSFCDYVMILLLLSFSSSSSSSTSSLFMPNFQKGGNYM